MISTRPLAQLQSRILIGTAILTSLGMAPQVFAQQASSLEEVVVTATKRDEMVQDVPVAVTALTQEVLETNQVVNVNDLSGLAPNMTVRPSAGGTNIPAFNMRGITSYGVVAGSDKQVSVYLDGIYIGSPRGSIFSLPDIQQLEVLRGPQGTLFGRNATGGAVSITTRSPSGQLGFRQKVTSGSRDLLATETTIDTPAFGDFSAYITYTKEAQDGDIKNLGAGTVWDRTALGYGTAKSPKTLGEKDNESIFLSALFEPNDEFNVSYKFDYATDKGSPAGTAIVGNIYAPGVGAAAPLVSILSALNNQPLTNPQTRPDEVNNAYSIPRDQKVQGHNLTATWNIRDDLTLKNTFGYREVQVWAPSDLTATSGWVAGPLGAVLGGPPGALDTPFCYVCTQPDSEGDQWSNEIQVDYDTDFVTVVGGALYYKSTDRSGGPRNAANTAQFGVFPGHVIGYTNQGVSYNKGESYAVFSQAEFHLTDALDIQAGLRYTYDDKSGDFVSGNDNIGLNHFPFTYDNENVSYLLGATYDITEDVMVYAKWSTAFVSGGSVAGLGFEPEEVESWEVGSKAEFFEGRLRSNIAIFDASYEKLQAAQSGSNVASAPPGVGVLIVDGGDLDATGVEWEVTALPLDGLTISAGLGYQNSESKNAPPLVRESVWANPPETRVAAPGATYNYVPGSSYEQTLAPEWNGNLSVNYETNPLFGSAYATFGVTGQWQDKVRLESNPARAGIFGVEFVPERWIVNARAALKGIELGGGWQGELALWGRNLTDDDSLNYITNFGAFAGGTFQEERTYGVDLVVKY